MLLDPHTVEVTAPDGSKRQLKVGRGGGHALAGKAQGRAACGVDI